MLMKFQLSVNDPLPNSHRQLEYHSLNSFGILGVETYWRAMPGKCTETLCTDKAVLGKGGEMYRKAYVPYPLGKFRTGYHICNPICFESSPQFIPMAFSLTTDST